MIAGQLIKNTETGRFGIVKQLLSYGRAVVTRCNADGIPSADTYQSSCWGMRRGPGIWITPLDKWKPATVNKSLVQQSLFA